MNKEKRFLVVDIETTGGFDRPLAYDVGIAIMNKKGKILYEHSYLISDTLINERMYSAFYYQKLNNYFTEHTLISISALKEEMDDIIKEYNVKWVAAYNASFDIRGLANTYGGNFFPMTVEIIDIWHIACQCLMNRNYFKIALQEKWYNESGNVKTNAECIYRYLIKDTDFTEKHTGLEDVKIECYILSKCIKYLPHIDTGINKTCYRLPQKAWKEYKQKHEKKYVCGLDLDFVDFGAYE